MIINPKTKHGIIYRNPNSYFGYSGWASCAVDADGTLYAVCSGMRAAHICPFGKTVMHKSTDCGETWSVPLIVNDTMLDDRDAGIIALRSGKLLVSWFVHPAQQYRTRWINGIKNQFAGSVPFVDSLYAELSDEDALGGSYVRTSDNGGMTWGETIRVPVCTPHGPIQLADSSLLYVGKEMRFKDRDGTPLSDAEAAYFTDTDAPKTSDDGNITVYRSDDEGGKWTRIGKIDVPADKHELYDEPHVVELDSGRLLCMVRVDRHDPPLTVYRTHSDDGGRTWSPLTPTGIYGGPPHLLRHSSGAIIMSLGYRREPYGQRAYVSYDNGESWRDEYILRDDGIGVDLGYPCTVELEGGELLTVYYQTLVGDKVPSLLYTKWSL